MFVEKTDSVDLTIYYRKLRHGYDAISEEAYEKLDEPTKQRFTRLTFNAKVLTWGLYNDLSERATTIDPKGNRFFNYKLWKEEKLKRVLNSWDATVEKDGENVPVPLKPENIQRLSPSVAEAMLQAYDDEMSLEEDDEKK